MNNYKKDIFSNFSSDVWTTLKNTKKPILIYGMGNGADKIISVFDAYNIKYSDVFASDGFVRGHIYRGKRVISYSEAVEKYGSDFDIVVSFGSKLPEVIERIYSLESNHNVYAPDVPVCGEKVFTEEFFDLHCDELYQARELFSDAQSKQVFDDIVRFKLTGKLEYLRSTAWNENEENKILHFDNYKYFVDLGAYNGDTIKKYSALCPNLQEIYAFEPDKRNFKKLSSYCGSMSNIIMNIENCASFSHDTILEFSTSGNRNSTAVSNGSYQHKIVQVEGKAPDSVCAKADFIKYDVEGMEYPSLLGSKKLIQTFSPDLLVSMYHKSEDLYELPILVKKLNPNYSLFLRRLPYIPAWDLNMYAVIN